MFNWMFHGLTQISTVHINRYICDAPVALLLWPLETAQPQLSAAFSSLRFIQSQPDTSSCYSPGKGGPLIHICVSFPVFQPTHRQAPSHVESSAWRTPRSLSALSTQRGNCEIFLTERSTESRGEYSIQRVSKCSWACLLGKSIGSFVYFPVSAVEVGCCIRSYWVMISCWTSE